MPLPSSSTFICLGIVLSVLCAVCISACQDDLVENTSTGGADINKPVKVELKLNVPDEDEINMSRAVSYENSSLGDLHLFIFSGNAFLGDEQVTSANIQRTDNANRNVYTISATLYEGEQTVYAVGNVTTQTNYWDNPVNALREAAENGKDDFLNTLYSLNENRLGIILENMSRMSFYTSYPVQSGPTDYVPSFIRLHLLGDPEMPVWSAVPQELDVDVSTSMRYDKKHMVSVRINNLPAGEEAVVCIEKATECYERFFISDNGTHQYVFSPKIGGTMQITVTARNFIPCVKTLNFTVNSQGVINIESLNELEDRQLKTGEDLSFDITLSSAIQPQKTTSAMATLTCSSPYITIDNPTVEYGSLLKNSTGVGDEKFRIHVSEDAPEIMRNQWNAACFTLTTVETGFSITDKKTSVDTFRVDIVSPRLRVASVKIVSTTDGDVNIATGGSWTLIDGDVVSEQ